VLFLELAEKFQVMVDIFYEMQESARSMTDENLLRTYELWTKTGSQRAARLLRKSGVYPLPSIRLSYEH